MDQRSWSGRGTATTRDGEEKAMPDAPKVHNTHAGTAPADAVYIGRGRGSNQRS